MKLRVSFYVILVFTMAAFAWWTYSLISLSYQAYVADADVIEFETHKAMRTVLTNSTFERNGDTTLQEIKLGTHNVYFDTAAMRQLMIERFPHTEMVFKDNKVEFVPRPDSLQQMENDKDRRVRMFFIEGIAFLILLMVGFSWIYNRLNSIIKLNQQKNNFLLAVTHELKTPMASVKLFLQTLQKRDLTREQLNPMIDNCIEDVNRLNDLAENMLLATRIESKSYQYNFERIDLSTLLSGMCEGYQKKYGGSYTITDKIEDNIELDIDEFSFTLAINNLFENALKYSPKGSEIKIILTREYDKVVLMITDQGPGIPKEERTNIFTKFYRLGSEATRTSKGTGLGLYIVKRIIENHHAVIDVQDNKPQGSIFKISFKPLTHLK